MLYRTLGKSDIPVSIASYGGGGPSQFGKAAGLTASQRRDLIARALDLGINMFDMAWLSATGSKRVPWSERRREHTRHR